MYFVRVLFHGRLTVGFVSFFFVLSFREIQQAWVLKIQSLSFGYKLWNNKLSYVMVRIIYGSFEK